MNSVTLIGRLGREPEIKFLQSGQAVMNVSLATTERWNDKDGNKQEKTEWHRLVSWGKQAEILVKYLHKGDQFACTGKLKYSEWQDKEGNKRTTAEIHIDSFDFIGGGKSNGAAAPQGSGGSAGFPAPGSRAKNVDDKYEDIPF